MKKSRKGNRLKATFVGYSYSGGDEKGKKIDMGVFVWLGAR